MSVVDLQSISACHPEQSVEVKRTFVANFKLVKVSRKCASNGLTITNMRVLEFPPSEYCSR